MGLSASMWTGVSGLLAHGNKMNVVGNNIANVSTIGFKSQRMDFNDYLYINGGSTSGPVQIGAGVATYALIGDFSQGSLESTNSVTDIAIDGEGFFKVRQPNSEQMYYTRAGDFYFNADRQLQNPEGYRLQGWKIDNSTSLTFKSESVNLGDTKSNESAYQGTGMPVDIVLDSWYLEPQRTSSVNFTIGLTSDGKDDNSTSNTSPLTALFDQWDARKQPPLAESAYNKMASPITVYDEAGNEHMLTVYYDQVATQAKDADGNLLYEISGLPAGYTMYEYVVTIPPEEDMRSFGGEGYNEVTNEFEKKKPTQFYNDPDQGTNKNAGMLMTGHLIFDSAGNLVNQTAYTYAANEYPSAKNQASANPAELGSWQATKFSSNGLPVLCANFTGQPLANSVSESLSPTQSQAQDYLIEIDFGLRTSGEWKYAGSLEDLRGTEIVPAENTPSRVSVGSKSLQGAAEYDATSHRWKVTYGDGANPATDTLDASSKLNVFYMDEKGNTQQLKVGSDGIKTVKGTFKDTTGNAYEGYALAKADGTPLVDGNNTPIAAAAIDKDTGAINYTTLATTLTAANSSLQLQQSVPYIPPNYLNGDFEESVNVGTEKDPVYKMQDLNLSKQGNIYAVNADGKKIGLVLYDEDGRITGICTDKNATTGEFEIPADPDKMTRQDYKDESLYFDDAVAQTKIDYNTDFSVFDSPIKAENATKAGGSSFVIQDTGQNGYASGVLSGTNITADGVVYGYYDNGETVPLYQIALYDFHNKQGLRREGGNLYAQTKESGEARQGVAGENGFGQTKAYNIEGSNVDLSREFVNMITTQRGFQANSKTVTTVDTMLETVIGMKR